VRFIIYSYFSLILSSRINFKRRQDMKKLVISLAVVAAILTLGAAVYAYGPGWEGGFFGCPGYGYGPQMMGPGPGYGPAAGWRGAYDQKSLDQTAALRRQLNDVRFDYLEAIRNPKTSPETVAKLEKKIGDLQEKLYANNPRRTYGGYAMPCWQY
jgi:hypothetical protein